MDSGGQNIDGVWRTLSDLVLLHTNGMIAHRILRISIVKDCYFRTMIVYYVTFVTTPLQRRLQKLDFPQKCQCDDRFENYIPLTAYNLFSSFTAPLNLDLIALSDS